MSSYVQVLDGVAEQVEARLPDVRGLAVLPISALTGAGTPQLLPAAVTLYEAWTRRIPTARLNRWLVAVSCPAVAAVAGCSLGSRGASCSMLLAGCGELLCCGWCGILLVQILGRLLQHAPGLAGRLWSLACCGWWGSLGMCMVLRAVWVWILSCSSCGPAPRGACFASMLTMAGSFKGVTM